MLDALSIAAAIATIVATLVAVGEVAWRTVKRLRKKQKRR